MTTESAPLTLHTFGGLSLSDARGRVPAGAAAQRRRLALLAVIAAAGPAGVSRDKLTALFWADSEDGPARRALNQALYALRTALDADDLLLGTTSLRLNPRCITSDVGDFLAAIAAGNREHAAALYQGPFLDGVHLPNAAEFEQWTDGEREHLRRIFLDTVTQLGRDAQHAGDLARAVRWWRRQLEVDPFDAACVRAIMRALADQGDVSGALLHARLYAARLEQELGLAPDAGVVELAEKLRQMRRITPREQAALAPDPAPPSRPEPIASVDPQSAEPPSAERPAPNPSPTRARFWALRAAAAVAVTALAIFVVARVARRMRPHLDPAVVAVPPFETFGEGLALWREGMMDLLSRGLDGAGPVRALPPSVVIQRWNGHPDAAAAQRLGATTRAGTVLLGQLLRTGADSVRATVAVIDAASGRTIGSIEARESLDRMDRLSDTLTVRLLRELDDVLPIGAVRRATPVRTPALPALKAFLGGEQFFRRAEWDSASVYYQRAVERDSGFALAHERLGDVLGWLRLTTDTLSMVHRLHAGALNHGLGPRDSLLVLADSLAAASDETITFLAAWPFTRRLFTTLDDALALYPGDPDVWFQVGEARYHYGQGPVIGVSDRQTLDAFDRAIALDSAFGPAYLHTPELALDIGGAALARRYLTAYLAHRGSEVGGKSLELVAQLLALAPRDSDIVRDLARGARSDVLFSARTTLRRWPDPQETAVQLVRILGEPPRDPAVMPRLADEAFRRRIVAEQLAYRGHSAEAAQVLGDIDTSVYIELAYVGGYTPAVAGALLANRLRAGSIWARQAMRWWSSRRDTATLKEALDRARQAGQHATTWEARLTARYDSAAALAHLTLARGDSADALRRFAALPDTLCARCYLDRLTRAELRMRAGRLAAARVDLDEPLAAYLTPIEMLFALDRARVAEQLGDRAAARRDYAFVAAAWAHADPALARYVAEAERALDRMSER